MSRKSNQRIPSRNPHRGRKADWSPSGLGLEPGRYEAAVSYLFDRPLPEGQQQAWYWDDEFELFAATPLEWTRLQTAIFANAAEDLRRFSDEQIGMGLAYITFNWISDVPYAAIDPTVPLDEAMRMMQAMSRLWQECIAPRMASEAVPIGHGSGALSHVCYMWFDEWPTYRLACHVPAWSDAVWTLLRQMLLGPCRAVQIAALHGIGHLGSDLDRSKEIDAAIGAFVRSLRPDDAELRTYAEAARKGNVQ